MKDSFEVEFLKKYCKKQRPNGCSNCRLFNQCFCRGCDGGFEYWDRTSLYDTYNIAVMAIDAEHVEKINQNSEPFILNTNSDRQMTITGKDDKVDFKFLLDNRQVVELRCGARLLVIDDYFIGQTNFLLKDDFESDLTNKSCSIYDIVKIYKEINELDDISCKYLDIIWERKPKKMTKEEIEEALGYEIEIAEEINK